MEEFILNQRDLTPDLMKIVAAIAVIIIHVTAGPSTKLPIGSFNHMAAVFLNAWTLFAVPCFIILSGLAMSLGYHEKAIEYVSFVSRRCRVVLIPYLIWAFAYYGLYLVMGIRTFSWSGFAIAIGLGKANYHLYFVPIILQLYLLYPVLRAIVKKLPTWAGVILFTAIHICYSKYIPQFPFRDRLFMSYLLFFIYGMYIGIHQDVFKSYVRKYAFPVMAIYLAGLYAYVNAKYQFYVLDDSKALGFFQLWQIFSLTSFLGLYTFCDWICSRITQMDNASSGTLASVRTISELSAATFTVYLIHPMVIIFLKKGYAVIGFSSIAGIMYLNALLVTLISFTIAVAYNRYKLIHSRRTST